MAVVMNIEEKILDWHKARNLIEGSTDIAQFSKLVEEVEELRLSLDGDLTPIDDIGDILVVLINIAHRNNLTLFECMYHAYNDSKYRTGRMVGGVFVKDLIDESGVIQDAV